MAEVDEQIRSTLDAQNDPYVPYVHSAQYPLTDLAYADDTLVIARCARIAQLIVHSIETVATTYNLTLNRGKCEMVRMYAHTDVKFTTGEVIKVVGPAGAKYLGALITPDGRSHK